MGLSVTTLYDHLSAQPMGLLALMLCAVMVGETLIFVGLMIPGDSLTVLSGTISTNPGRLLYTVAAATLGSVVGEVVGFGIGHRLGRRLSYSVFSHRMSRRRHWQRARQFVSEEQRWHTLLWLRFVPVVHTLVPLAAGASGKSFRWFLRWSAVSSLIWSTLYVGLGATARASAGHAAPWIPFVTLLIPTISIGTSVVRRLARRRRRQRAVRGYVPPPPPPLPRRTEETVSAQLVRASEDRHFL
jgi:membrane protein DedA with SNARE-associated domain